MLELDWLVVGESSHRMRGPGKAGRQRCGRACRQLVVFVLLLLGSSGLVDGKDLYKVLGVDKQASQADIKKAFHKQSLKYHPDKNPSKDAQVKFTEISNAYEILSDEEKRTNYDTHGDAEGPKGPTGGPFGWQRQGHQGGRQYFYQSSEPSFTWSYDGTGGGGGSNGYGNIFDQFFEGARGGNQGNHHFQEQRGSRSTLFDSMDGVDKLSGANIRQQVINKGKLAWLVLFYNPNNQHLQPMASALKEVVDSLRGMIKVGVIDCASQKRLCDTEGALPLQDAKAFVYPYGGSDPSQYNGPWTAKSLKSFVTTHLPRKSTRLDTENFLQLFPDHHVLARVILLTRKKETPAMWRALSGIYDNQVAFFDLQVEDELDPLAKRFGVTDFPAVVGVFANGKETLLAGKADLEGTKTFDILKGLIEKLRKENKEAGLRQGDSQTEVPFLSKSNMDLVCGEDSPLCIIAVIKSLKHGGKLQQILTEVSRKTLVRQVDSTGGKKSALSYSLVDASKHSSFLKAFGNPKSDSVIVAYKPRRKRYAVLKGVSTLEEVESFVSQALGGDLHFETCKNGPVLSA